MRDREWRSVSAVAVLLLAAAPVSQGGREAGGRILEAADGLLEGLTDGQRQRLQFDFVGEERLDWHYIPRDRIGLPLGAMDDEQRAAARRLVSSGLGEQGADLAWGVIGLEHVLFEASGGRAMRDPGNYFLAFFGQPSNSTPWGWRFEGHHLSVNFTFRDGAVVSSTPAFFGANPARVDSGERAGLRVLAAEEDLARRLVRGFTGALRERVVIAAAAPNDILTGNAVPAEMGAPEGVALGEMAPERAEQLLGLLEVYTRRLAPALAEQELAELRAGGIERLHFAWAGSMEPGEPHYYRIQGPTFVIEYDNTQNDANHIHTVWRDLGDEFGGDPLRAHLAADHRLQVAGAHDHRGSGAHRLAGGQEPARETPRQRHGDRVHRH